MYCRSNQLVEGRIVQPTKVVTKADPKVFQEVGRCIYCGTVGDQLSREHVVPIGLGGGFVLPAASCSACARVTQQFETVCQRKIFVAHRVAQRLVRHKSEIDPNRNDPNHLLMPEIHGLPGMLGRRNPEAPFCLTYRFSGYKKDWPNDGQQMVRSFDLAAFTRMLAKIGHSYAVGEFGLNAFDPELPPFILGRSPNLGPYFIGESVDDVPLAGNVLHQIGHSFAAHGNNWLIVVRIKLFAAQPTPAYNVIVGSLIEDALARFDLARA